MDDRWAEDRKRLYERFESFGGRTYQEQGEAARQQAERQEAERREAVAAEHNQRVLEEAQARQRAEDAQREQEEREAAERERQEALRLRTLAELAQLAPGAARAAKLAEAAHAKGRRQVDERRAAVERVERAIAAAAAAVEAKKAAREQAGDALVQATQAAAVGQGSPVDVENALAARDAADRAIIAAESIWEATGAGLAPVQAEHAAAEAVAREAEMEAVRAEVHRARCAAAVIALPLVAELAKVAPALLVTHEAVERAKQAVSALPQYASNPRGGLDVYAVSPRAAKYCELVPEIFDVGAAINRAVAAALRGAE
jgi:hypothetical protein